MKEGVKEVGREVGRDGGNNWGGGGSLEMEGRREEEKRKMGEREEGRRGG